MWGGRIVSESTLTSHINAVRKAIGDSGQEQRLIRTVARKGFRFVGEVSEVRSSEGSASPNAELTELNEAPALALDLPDKPSIAVLPFLNLSGDPEQEYFADGMVEDIITALSRIRWLFVIARNSSFTYKGRAVDVKQVGRELGVRYVLEGSVRKAANRVRITGQLIDATTGAHLWADRFEGTLDDIFDLQDQVTASVVGAIAPQLERAEIERAKRKPTESLDAYDYYLRGMAHFHQGTREGMGEALPLFYKAIELDPGFRLGLRDGRVVPFLAEAQRLDDRSLRGDRRGHATGAPRRRARQGRRRRAYPRRPRARAPRRRPRWRHRLRRSGAAAQSESRGRLVPRRLPQDLARRAGRGDRAPRPRHAPEPARFRDVPHAGRHGARRISWPGASTPPRHGRRRPSGNCRPSCSWSASSPQARLSPAEPTKLGKR